MLDEIKSILTNPPMQTASQPNEITVTTWKVIHRLSKFLSK